jgi:hypothetical protein
MSFLKFNFVAYYEEFHKHFLAEADDHTYDNVYQVVKKSVQLLKTKELKE